MAAAMKPQTAEQVFVTTANPKDAEGGISEREDVLGDRLSALLKQYGATWNGDNDPRDPYNWSTTRKITTAAIVSIGQLITLMSASVIAAPLGTIAKDLDMDPQQAQIAFSIFLLGLGFAPFVIAALSEMYGRKPIWIFSNVWYIFWNSMCPVGHSKELMILGRFMAASGASVGITLTAPVLTDLYRQENRGKSLAIANFLPYLGPALGPIVGGVVSQHVRWEWLFWILSIFDGIVTLIGIAFFKETYTPVLLQRKAKKLRAMSTSANPVEEISNMSETLYVRLPTSLSRPIMLLVKRPIMQYIALITAVNFGTYCLMLSTYATLWIQRYNQSQTSSSLNYISLAIGTTLAAQAGGPLMDAIFKRLQIRQGGKAQPEFRAPFMIPGVILVPIGLILYGWTAQHKIHWSIVDTGAAIFTTGSFLLAQGLIAYVFDEFEHAASANAASKMLSYVFGFTFPIFAPAMYDLLGYGWGNTLLAFVFLVVGAPTPFVLWFWGPRLRALGRSRTAG